MALTGTFEDVSFAEVLQMLNVGNKSGRLSVARPGEEAVLYVERGNVARAVSRRDRGPELVYKLLGWKVGEFSFEPTQESVARNIHESTEALILEGMKRLDEWERVEEELPDMHVVLRQRASAVNQRFDELSPEAQTLLRLVDAQRNVATIIRESGLEPIAAVKAVTELLAGGVVERWSGARQSGDVILTEGRLPQAQGAIDMSTRAYSSSGDRGTSKEAASAVVEGGDPPDSQ